MRCSVKRNFACPAGDDLLDSYPVANFSTTTEQQGSVDQGLLQSSLAGQQDASVQWILTSLYFSFIAAISS